MSPNAAVAAFPGIAYTNLTPSGVEPINRRMTAMTNDKGRHDGADDSTEGDPDEGKTPDELAAKYGRSGW